MMKDVSPALADIVMSAGYHAIDILYCKVSCISFDNLYIALEYLFSVCSHNILEMNLWN
jgi:hypothetical protein